MTPPMRSGRQALRDAAEKAIFAVNSSGTKGMNGLEPKRESY
jgi:hypothetical protein